MRPVAAVARPVTVNSRPVKCRLQMDTDGDGALRVALRTQDYVFLAGSTYSLRCNVDQTVLPSAIRFVSPSNTLAIRMEMPHEPATEAVTAAMSECFIEEVVNV